MKKLREKNRPAVNALGVASGIGPIVALNAVRTSAAWRQSKRRPKHTASKSGWRRFPRTFPPKKRRREARGRPVAAISALSVGWFPDRPRSLWRCRPPSHTEPPPSGVNLGRVLTDGPSAAGHLHCRQQSVRCAALADPVPPTFTATQPATINPWTTAPNREPAASGFVTSLLRLSRCFWSGGCSASTFCRIKRCPAYRLFLLKEGAAEVRCWRCWLPLGHGLPDGAGDRDGTLSCSCPAPKSKNFVSRARNTPLRSVFLSA